MYATPHPQRFAQNETKALSYTAQTFEPNPGPASYMSCVQSRSDLRILILSQFNVKAV